MMFGTFIKMGEDPNIAKECAVEAERFGYDFIWLFDAPTFSDSFVDAAMLCPVTTKVRIGPATIYPFLRHPVMIAGFAYTLDKISKGRAWLGIAAGTKNRCEQFGVGYERPVLKLKESIEIIKVLFTGEEVNYEGRTTTVKKIGFRLKQKLEIPVFAIVSGPQMVRMAGEVADGVVVAHVPIAYFDIVREQLRIGAAKSGRSLNEFNVGLHIEWFVHEDYDKALNLARAWFPASVLSSAAVKYPVLYEKCNCSKDEIEMIRKDIRKVPTETIDKIMEEISIIGSVDDCIHRIKEYEKQGVTNFQVNPFHLSETPAEVNKGNWDVLKGIKIFGEKIIPAFEAT